MTHCPRGLPLPAFDEYRYHLFNISCTYINALRLGRREPLLLDDIDALYNGCTFGQAWKPKVPSPFCKVFTEHELELMEYREDLEYFWVDGYGFDVTQKIPCVIMLDVLDRLG